MTQGSSLTQSATMLGAAGRTAGGLVKQAVKAGNVQQILPAASVSRKYLFFILVGQFVTLFTLSLP